MIDLTALQTVGVAYDRIAEMQLDQLLYRLSMIGEILIWTNDKNLWTCKVSVFVTGKGITFEIKSIGDHEAAILATRDCYGRTIKALRDVGVNI